MGSPHCLNLTRSTLDGSLQEKRGTLPQSLFCCGEEQRKIYVSLWLSAVPLKQLPKTFLKSTQDFGEGLPTQTSSLLAQAEALPGKKLCCSEAFGHGLGFMCDPFTGSFYVVNKQLQISNILCFFWLFDFYTITNTQLILHYKGHHTFLSNQILNFPV